MKSALCFYGQPRFIDNEHCYNSHKKFILDQNNVDVFTHYWFDEKLDKFQTSDWSSHHNNYIHKDCNNIIEKLYKPLVRKIESPKTFFDDDIEKCVSHLNFYNKNNFNNLRSHLYSFEESIKLALNYVKNTGEIYDYIILSRFDHLIHQFPNLQELESDKLYVDNKYPFVDFCFILPFKMINSFSPFSDFINISKSVSSMTSEEFKKHAFLRNYNLSDVNNSKLNVTIARDKYDFIGQG